MAQAVEFLVSRGWQYETVLDMPLYEFVLWSHVANKNAIEEIEAMGNVVGMRVAEIVVQMYSTSTTI